MLAVHSKQRKPITPRAPICAACTSLTRGCDGGFRARVSKHGSVSLSSTCTQMFLAQATRWHWEAALAHPFHIRVEDAPRANKWSATASTFVDDPVWIPVRHREEENWRRPTCSCWACLAWPGLPGPWPPWSPGWTVLPWAIAVGRPCHPRIWRPSPLARHDEAQIPTEPRKPRTPGANGRLISH